MLENESVIFFSADGAPYDPTYWQYSCVFELNSIRTSELFISTLLRLIDFITADKRPSSFFCLKTKSFKDKSLIS
jgi:hypothetical protein